jgi:hypothetical protein
MLYWFEINCKAPQMLVSLSARSRCEASYILPDSQYAIKNISIKLFYRKNVLIVLMIFLVCIVCSCILISLFMFLTLALDAYEYCNFPVLDAEWFGRLVPLVLERHDTAKQKSKLHGTEWYMMQRCRNRN